MRRILTPLRRAMKRKPTVAVLRLAGPIGDGGRFSAGLSLARLERDIDRAFALKRAKAVALEINSPGGSPSQSALIAERIRALAAEKKLPVYAFCEDAAASGGYMLACAADEIYADAYSIVGSIGVISASFGLKDAMERLGVERRLHTAGRSKALMDPFSGQNDEDRARLRRILEEIHARFIDYVKTRRGDRLDLSTPDLFEGEVWVGAQAVSPGLIDGIGHMRAVLRDKFGEDVALKRIAPKQGLAARFGRSVSGGLAEGVADMIESRAAWARIGS